MFETFSKVKLLKNVKKMGLLMVTDNVKYNVKRKMGKNCSK